MDIYEFMSNNPVLTLLLACIIGFVIMVAFKYIFLAFNRLVRHANINNKGWPPPHLDADGNFIDEEE